MEEIINKIKVALVNLRLNQSVKLEDLRLENTPTLFKVIGWSEFSNFSLLTRAQSLKELQKVKELFYSLMEVSLELKDFIDGRNIEFNLFFDDYGKASIAICSEVNNIIKWSARVKD